MKRGHKRDKLVNRVRGAPRSSQDSLEAKAKEIEESRPVTLPEDYRKIKERLKLF